MHIHVSLADDDGSNLFAAEEPARNTLLMHAIGGLKSAMAESMLIFAPNANSYRRFRRNSYAPLAASWASTTHGEPARAGGRHRPAHRAPAAGADANPYLVMAAVIAGMFDAS